MSVIIAISREHLEKYYIIAHVGYCAFVFSCVYEGREEGRRSENLKKGKLFNNYYLHYQYWK